MHSIDISPNAALFTDDEIQENIAITKDCFLISEGRESSAAPALLHQRQVQRASASFRERTVINILLTFWISSTSETKQLLNAVSAKIRMRS